MRKLSKTISQESANISVKETLINLLQKNRTEKVGGREEEEKRYHRVRLSIKKYFRRSRNHRSNATIWSNHRMMRAAIKKKMMVLTSCKLATSPEQNWRRNVEIGFTAIYAMNISAQSAMTREVFPQMMIFLYYLYRIINIKVRFLFSCPLGHFIMQWSHQRFSAYLLENDEAQLKNSNYIVLLFAWLCSMAIHLFKSKSTKKPQEQSVRPQRCIQNPVEYLR